MKRPRFKLEEALRRVRIKLNSPSIEYLNNTTFYESNLRNPYN